MTNTNTIIINKLFNISNQNSEIVGTINQETYGNNLKLYAVNTQSVGISFKTLPEAIEYIEKYNYKIAYDTVTPSGYSFKDVKINIMEQLGDYEENFETIYNLLLAYTINKAFIEFPNSEYINIKDVFTTVLNILDAELDKQYIMYEKVNKKFLNDDIAFELQDSSYKLNEKYINDNTFYRIINNSVDDILLRVK